MPLRLISAIQRATSQIGNSIASVKGLSVNPSEAHILAHLAELGETTIDGLHRTLGLHHSTLTSVINRLVSRRLVSRRVYAKDRRSFVVHLTARGRSVARRIVDAMTAVEATALGGVSPAMREELLRVLLRF